MTGPRSGRSRRPAAGREATARSMEKLPGGHHGLEPAEVTANQIDRLIRAEIEVVTRESFGPAPIRDVTGLAGVSRATFYEHFEDRVDLFCAARRWLEEEIELAVRRNDRPIPGLLGTEPERDLADEDRATIAAIHETVDRALSAAEAVPGGVAFLLWGTLSGGRAAVDLHLAFLDRWAERLRTALGQTVPEGSGGRIRSRAALGSVLASIEASERRGERADRAEATAAALLPAFRGDRAMSAVREAIH